MTDRKFPTVGGYIGRIISELRPNAIEHALGERKERSRSVSPHQMAAGSIRVQAMVVLDSPGFEINKTGSFGLHLVKILN